MNIKENKDAKSVNLLDILPDNASVLSTPSQGFSPIYYGLTRVNRSGGQLLKIRHTATCLATLMVSLKEEDKLAIQQQIEAGDPKQIVDICTKAITAEVLKRFFEKMPAASTSWETGDLVYVDNGIEGLNKWVADKEDIKVINLAELHAEMHKVNDSTINDVVLNLLESYGMPSKVAGHMMNKRDKLMMLADYVSPGSIATRTQYVGAPLFMALGLIYQCHDEVDIALYGDYLLFQPKGNPAEDMNEVCSRMGINNVAQELEIDYKIHALKYEPFVTHQTFGLQLVNRFVIDPVEVQKTKSMLVVNAARGNAIEAKACIMQLTYFSWVTGKQVDAFNGLNSLLRDIPSNTILPGVSMRYNHQTQPGGYRNAHDDSDVFDDSRAYIETVGKAITRTVRQIRLNRHVQTDRSGDFIANSVQVTNEVLETWLPLYDGAVDSNTLDDYYDRPPNNDR